MGGIVQNAFNVYKDVVDQDRKTAAYNALKAVYGDAIAYDPTQAFNASKADVQGRTADTQVQQADANLTGKNLENTGQDLTNQGTAETNNFNALANPIKLTGLGLTNDKTVAETGQANSATAENNAQTGRINTLLPGEVTQQKASTGLTRAQTAAQNADATKTGVETQAARVSLSNAQSAQHRATAMGIMSALSDVAASNGDISAAFDKFAPLISKLEGIDPSHMEPLKAALVQDPIGTINKLSAGIQQAQMTASGQAKPTTATGALALMKFSAGQMNLADGLRFTQQRIAAVPEKVEQAQQFLANMSPSAIVRKVNANRPGTPEYQFLRAVDSIKSNLSVDDLRALREGGLSLGRTNLAEFQASADAVANLDLGQNPALLAGNLKRIDGMYQNTNSTLQAQIDRVAKGTTPGQGLNVQPKFQQGQVYKDASGNQARFNNGKWEPVK